MANPKSQNGIMAMTPMIVSPAPLHMPLDRRSSHSSRKRTSVADRIGNKANAPIMQSLTQAFEMLLARKPAATAMIAPILMACMGSMGAISCEYFLASRALELTRSGRIDSGLLMVAG